MICRWVFYPPGHVPPSVTIHVDEDGDMATDSPSSLQVSATIINDFYSFR